MKKKRPYFIAAGLVILLFLILFIGKGIFPFGKNSLIWGDMHDQITAFYYHFYDCFKGNASLFVNFSTSGGINFFGILAYYILSPFSFLIFLFDRDQIYLVVSIIVAGKVLLASLTSLYFIQTFFKKLPSMLSVLLAIVYAFSGYTMIMYQITPWMDVVYLLPLIMVGLKKVLDGGSPVLYIVSLTLSIILCFYISYMVVLFIFFASLIYLLVYKEVGERKKGVIALGFSTISSMLISCFVVIPAYQQISISSRLSFNLNELLNSGTGPIIDKTSFFASEAIFILALIFLLVEFKKHKKFLSWFLPTCLIMFVPYLIEPVNKVWHFGSYAFFPYRAGFITIFLLLIGTAYYFNQTQDSKEKVSNRNKIISILMTILVMTSVFLTSFFTYRRFQTAVNSLTISNDRFLIFFLGFMTFSVIVGIFSILHLNRRKNHFTLTLILLTTFTHLTCVSYLYMGIDQDQKRLTSQYIYLNQLEKTYQEGDYFRVKNLTSSLIMNTGMVSRYHTLDHFTSLTDGTNLQTLKKMGYSSMWVKTFSKGGTLFSDALLANKYVMSKKTFNNPYYDYVDRFGDIDFYKMKKDPSYGYFMSRNDTIFNKNNAFEIQNSMYQSITGSQENLFTIGDEFLLHNLKKEKKKERFYYRIKDSDAYNYLEQTFKVEKKRILYLEVLKSLDNLSNYDVYGKMNIYVNNQLLQKNYPTENSNGLLELGTFENEEVNIRIELNLDIELQSLTIGAMDIDKYENFMDQQKIDTKISYDKNNALVQVNSNKKQILFLPITYNEGYQAKINGKTVKVMKLYENYVGVEIEKGEQSIELSFTPSGLKMGVVISLFALVFTILCVRFSLYQKLIECKLLGTIAYFSYLLFYLLAVIVVYILPILGFILSYFFTIHI